MKAGLVSVTLVRFVEGADGGYNRSSRAFKTWREATTNLREWLRDATTRDNDPNTILVRPRWQNGLTLYEIGFDRHDASNIADLGAALLAIVWETYGTVRGKKLRSMKAAVAHEVLNRCSFTDAAENLSEDARTFDVASRALHAMFPDEATLHVDRIRAWMLDGGRVR